MYAYTHADPTNKTDPSGNDAIITITDNTKVKIVVPIAFSGKAATSDNIKAIRANIEKKWSGAFGKYEVSTRVEVVTSDSGYSGPIPPNEIAVVGGRTDHPSGHSFVRNGTQGQISMQDIRGGRVGMTIGEKGEDTAAHEGGHLMRIDANTEQAPGTLMNEGPGTEVTEENIETIISHPNNEVTREYTCEAPDSETACGD